MLPFDDDNLHLIHCPHRAQAVKGFPPKLTLLEPHIFEMKSIKKVLLLGSGGLSIGQAGEFDYSGSQVRGRSMGTELELGKCFALGVSSDVMCFRKLLFIS